MSSMRMVLTLSIIIAFLALVTADYTVWLVDNGIYDGDMECKPRQTETSWVGSIFGEVKNTTMVTEVDCGQNTPEFFNLIWIAPLIAVLGYALVPFVK